MNLIVNYLPSEMEEEHLVELFSPYGPILSHRIIRCILCFAAHLFLRLVCLTSSRSVLCFT